MQQALGSPNESVGVDLPGEAQLSFAPFAQSDSERKTEYTENKKLVNKKIIKKNRPRQ